MYPTQHVKLNLIHEHDGSAASREFPGHKGGDQGKRFHCAWNECNAATKCPMAYAERHNHEIESGLFLLRTNDIDTYIFIRALNRKSLFI